MLNWQGWAATNFVGWGSAGEATPPAVVTPYPGAAGRSRRGRRPHHSVIEVDGEIIRVEGYAQAEAILEQVKAKAREEAPKLAKRALNKARDVERKTGELPEIEVEPPVVRAVEATDAFAEMVARGNAEIERIYEQAERDAELALRARRAYFEQDEEDAIMALLVN